MGRLGLTRYNGTRASRKSTPFPVTGLGPKAQFIKHYYYRENIFSATEIRKRDRRKCVSLGPRVKKVALSPI